MNQEGLNNLGTDFNLGNQPTTNFDDVEVLDMDTDDTSSSEESGGVSNIQPMNSIPPIEDVLGQQETTQLVSTGIPSVDDVLGVRNTVLNETSNQVVQEGPKEEKKVEETKIPTLDEIFGTSITQQPTATTPVTPAVSTPEPVAPSPVPPAPTVTSSPEPVVSPVGTPQPSPMVSPVVNTVPETPAVTPSVEPIPQQGVVQSQIPSTPTPAPQMNPQPSTTEPFVNPMDVTPTSTPVETPVMTGNQSSLNSQIQPETPVVQPSPVVTPTSMIDPMTVNPTVSQPTPQPMSAIVEPTPIMDTTMNAKEEAVVSKLENTDMTPTKEEKKEDLENTILLNKQLNDAKMAIKAEESKKDPEKKNKNGLMLVIALFTVLLIAVLVIPFIFNYLNQ